MKTVPELKPDLLFLDVEMPKLDGFEVLKLMDGPPEVIFATAYDQFAMKAFDAAAVDYFLSLLTGALSRVAGSGTAAFAGIAPNENRCAGFEGSQPEAR